MAKGKQIRRPATAAKVEADEVLVDIVEVRDRAQNFFERYRTFILGGLIGLVVILAAVVGWRLYLQVNQTEAVEQMAQAQKQFERDSFAIALTNPGGGFSGFLDIMENYAGTPAANLAHYYAGVCYLNLGKFEVAADYLKDYRAKGLVMPIMKNGALGDCYSELKDFKKALRYYEAAVAAGTNDYLTPYYLKKTAMLAEKQQDYAKARQYFQRIKDDFPNSTEFTEVDKYLIYLEGK